MNSNGVEFENYERRDERIPDIDAIEEARYEMMMGGVNEFKKEDMSKTFDKEIDFYIGGVKVGGSTISKSPDDKHLDTQAAEDEFYAILRKNEKSILLEAEEYEKSYIIDHLTREQEDKLGEECMKDYHGDKDHWEDAYERFLEELTLEDYKRILSL